MAFLVKDPTGRYETGDPYVWTNRLILRNRLVERDGQRFVELFVAPRGEIRYTLDGREPRHGISYTGPFTIGDGETLVRAFASADGLEAKEDFRFGERGRKEVKIIAERPARLTHRAQMKLDSRAKTFEGLQLAGERQVRFENVMITVGQGAQVINVIIGEIEVDAAFLTRLLTQLTEKLSPDAPVTMAFKRAHFAAGRDAQEFANRLGIPLMQENIEQ